MAPKRPTSSTGAVSSADALLDELHIPRDHRVTGIFDDDGPDQLEQDWSDAVTARYGEVASSSSGSSRKRSISSSVPGPGSGKSSNVSDADIPLRCYINPENKNRVMAEFPGGRTRVLGN